MHIPYSQAIIIQTTCRVVINHQNNQLSQFTQDELEHLLIPMGQVRFNPPTKHTCIPAPSWYINSPLSHGTIRKALSNLFSFSSHGHHSKTCSSPLHLRKRKLLASCLLLPKTTTHGTESRAAKCTPALRTCTPPCAVLSAASTSTSCAGNGGTAREGAKSHFDHTDTPSVRAAATMLTHESRRYNPGLDEATRPIEREVRVTCSDSSTNLH